MKEILFLKRGKGKTTKLIQKALRNKGSYMVVLSPAAAKQIMESYPKLKGRVLSVEQAKQALYGVRTTLGKVPKLYVDDADAILYSIFNHPVELMSVTKG